MGIREAGAYPKKKIIEGKVGKIGRQTVIRVPTLIRDYYGLDKIEKVILRPKSAKELTLKVEK